MAKRSKPPRNGLSPGKAVMIGVLAVVLLLVIVIQFGGKKERSPKAVAARRTAPEDSESATVPAVTVTRSASAWPTFDVEEVVARNPFVLPASLRPEREAGKTLTASLGPGEDGANISAVEPAEIREMRRRQAEFMAGLRAKGVDMILRSPRGSVARIGDLSLRVGDVHEGLRVEAIGQHGVTFSPAEISGWQPE